MVRKCISGGRESQEQWAVPELSGKYFCKGCGWAKKPEPCGSGFSVGWFARIKTWLCESAHVGRTFLSDAFDLVLYSKYCRITKKYAGEQHRLCRTKMSAHTRDFKRFSSAAKSNP